ncbi:GspH/FimT family pseudopilin [Piscinibacter sp.]|uniref:GspH/FimT family pseudopilin n=1 Tax=Piscinibacter sp. TaxID=1903157 RepID=UPI002CDEE95E|nr:GspH/FimT family pseudopilin [Albitalea sp.]HUG22269.1 GspH/FimT family pseudopilin [Albitalea sp.]
MHGMLRLLSSGRRHRTDRARGFTLIELLTVMALLAILMAVVAPSFREFLQSQYVKSVAYDLTADLLLARNEALKRNGNVSIEPSGDSWADGWTITELVNDTQVGQRNAADASVTVDDGPAGITFDANGRVFAPAAQVRMTLSAAGTNHRCIQLDLSGRARSVVGACP